MTPTPTKDLLTAEEVAEWLQIEKRQLERFGVPCIYLGHKTRRYLTSEVVEWLKTKRER